MSTSFKDPSLFPIKGFQHGELFSMQTARHDKAAIRTNAAMQRSKCARPMPHRDTTTGRARQLDSGRSRHPRSCADGHRRSRGVTGTSVWMFDQSDGAQRFPTDGLKTRSSSFVFVLPRFFVVGSDVTNHSHDLSGSTVCAKTLPK